MGRYKHYSFDLWMTLIKSNPEFKNKRTELFFDMFNPKGKTFKEVGDIIRHIDVSTNAYCEISGKHVDSRRMIYDILIALEYKIPKLKEVTILDIIDKTIQETFLENLPILYSNETRGALEGIRNSGATISISSNTGFIHGDTLRSALIELGIYGLFNFFVFSDEIDYSKPSPIFFYRVYYGVISINKHIKFGEHDSILHIGDNPYADIEGAKNFGFDTFQINTNDKTILDILL